MIDEYPVTPTEQVESPVMRQEWRNVAFLHWPYEPEVVQSNLPAGLTVDLFDGRAWVGLVAFEMRDIRFGDLPPIPYFGSFPETNVRTYVRGPDGRPGVWFDSLDITRLLPVAVARIFYRIPYNWAAMDIAGDDRSFTYQAQRRSPAGRGAASRVTVEVGNPIEAASDFDRFLTARWGLYTHLAGRTIYAPVDHGAWPLHAAAAADIDDGFIEAAGYPAPSGPPTAHFSPGVQVAVGRPRFVPSRVKVGLR